MENKKYIICLLVIFCVFFLAVGYFNYEKIVSFFEDREWEIADSFATLNIENISQVEGGKSLLVLTNSTLELYENNSKNVYKENMVTPGLLTHSCEEYMVVVRKDNNSICLLKGSEIVWENDFNWTIMNTSVNKNGYVIVIYSQSGYKSSIKIFKPTGEELFTTYLASTYALDVEMSNDNKYLYIAEIDTEGIKIKSDVKIIEVIEAENKIEPQVETVLIGTDELITDIEFSSQNELLILKDTGIVKINTLKQKEKIETFDIKNTLFSSIKDIANPIVIEKVSTGIFTNETNLKIYSEEDTIEVKIEQTPQNIDTMHERIALNLGNEVLFLNTSGKVLKRYEVENKLTAVKLYNKGTLAALVFRDRIELVKI